jgi:alanyl-tRNA synthetase
MGEVYPALRAKAGQIRQWTMMEEERFLETIEGGLTRLDGLLGSGATVIPGEEVFKLYDTFGFPLDLTMLIAEERGASVDVAGFETALNRQRKRSRDARATQQGGSRGACGSSRRMA